MQLEPGGSSASSDALGRFSFAAAAGSVTLAIAKAGMTAVERAVTVEAGVGTVAIDARLTPVSTRLTIDSAGGSLNASFPRRLRPPDPNAEPATPAALVVTLPPGAVAGPGEFRLTALGAQGLPALLPLGFSPVVAFVLDGTAAPSTVDAHVTGLPSLQLHLVAWDVVGHSWTLVASPATPTDGMLDMPLPALGSYALVAVDPGPGAPVLPAPGAPLTSADFVPIPDGAVGRSFADPPSLPSTGGTSRGRIEVDSPQPLPSGTVVQAVLSESFRLVSGETASQDERLEDILLFRADVDGFVQPETGTACLAAEIPIVPSREHSPIELEEGRVSLRVLAGREGTRGAGGSNATTVSSDGASLEIPAGALPADTAVSLALAPSPSPVALEPPGLTAVAELRVDFTGATLALAAGLRVPAAGVPPGGSVFVARMEQAGGATRLQVVAWAERQGDEIVTVVRPHLPGLRRGGRYVVYHAAPAVGFLAGTTRAAGAPRPALVTHLASALRRSLRLRRGLQRPDARRQRARQRARARHVARGQRRHGAGGGLREGTRHRGDRGGDARARDARVWRDGRSGNTPDRAPGDGSARPRKRHGRECQPQADERRRGAGGAHRALGRRAPRGGDPAGAARIPDRLHLRVHWSAQGCLRRARRRARRRVHDAVAGPGASARPRRARLLLPGRRHGHDARAGGRPSRGHADPGPERERWLRAHLCGRHLRQWRPSCARRSTTACGSP